MYGNHEPSRDERPKKVQVRSTTEAEDVAAAAAADSNDSEEEVEDEIPSFVGELVAKDFDGDTFFGTIKASARVMISISCGM
jgi:hypothetical protein